MPRRPLRKCITPGCRALTESGRCDLHQAINQRATERRRGSAYSRGYGRAWALARKEFLVEHPFCECAECKSNGRQEVATVVDHIIPHRGDEDLFWDRANWQAMSKEHHDKKTAREDGGFGNAPRRSSDDAEGDRGRKSLQLLSKDRGSRYLSRPQVFTQGSSQKKAAQVVGR